LHCNPARIWRAFRQHFFHLPLPCVRFIQDICTRFGYFSLRAAKAADWYGGGINSGLFLNCSGFKAKFNRNWTCISPVKLPCKAILQGLSYHVGPIGPAKDDEEFFSAFKWDAKADKGVLMDSAKYGVLQ
jgi:hypothetical protein